MKVGDLVKHKHSTIAGYGIILTAPPVSRGHTFPTRLRILWYYRGNVSLHKLDRKWIEVISEAS